MPTVLAKPEGRQLELSAPQLQVRLARGPHLLGCVCMAPCVECAHYCVPKTGGWHVNMPPENCGAAQYAAAHVFQTEVA